MRIAAALGVAATIGAGSAAAQTHLPPEPMFCNPASHEHDAVTAAPYSHSVIFEDSHVRVLEVLVPPLASEPIHIHALPSVMMGDTGGGAGAKFIYTTYKMEDGKFVEVEKQEITPTTGYRTVWSAPEGPHSITNVGTSPMRLTRIEMKPETCAR
jgi:hypothetical protein